MKVMFSINADVDGASNAEELRDKIVELFKQHGLEGSVRGDKYPSGAFFTATYQKRRKAAKSKQPPKFDPSQYLKGIPQVGNTGKTAQKDGE